MKKKTCSCELALLLALGMSSLGIALLNKSGLGVTTSSALPLVLHEIFPAVSFGLCHNLMEFLLLGATVFITKRPQVSYLISVGEGLVFGRLLDLFEILIAPLGQSLPLRVVWCVLGFLLMAGSLAFTMNCRLPIQPIDIFCRDVKDHYHISLRVFRTGYDLTCLVLCLLLGWLVLGRLAGVGAATFFCAFFTGTTAAWFSGLLAGRYRFLPSFAFSARFCTPVMG